MKILCPHCKNKDLIKKGYSKNKYRGRQQRYFCKPCERKFVKRTIFYKIKGNQSIEHRKKISETRKRLFAEGKIKSWNKGLPKEMQPMFGKISNWKGDRVTRGPLHIWIKNHKTKSELCENCKQAIPYDLANISGEYKRDINDFKWLCRSCHMREDGRINNLKQFKML